MEGYLLIEDLLDSARDTRLVMAEYEGVLDGIARSLHREGAIASLHRELPFAERLIQVCAESGRNFPQHFDFSLPQSGIRDDTPMHLGPAAFDLLTHPRLLDLAEDLLGPELYSSPV